MCAMHKNPVAILLTVLAIVILSIFLYAIYKVYKQNTTHPDAVSGNYVISDDGDATPLTSPAPTAQETVTAVIADAGDTDDSDTLPPVFTDVASVTPQSGDAANAQPAAPATPVVSTTSPATGPGAGAMIFATVGALLFAIVYHKMAYNRMG